MGYGMSDKHIMNVIHKFAPHGYRRLTLTYALTWKRSQIWARVQGGGGTLIPWEPPYELKVELANAWYRERIPRRGGWISITVSIQKEELLVERNWNERIYFGDHPGAPFEPPASGEVDPTDEMWRYEFGIWRSAEYIPDWLPPRAEPLRMMDYALPLTGMASDFASDPETASWFELAREILRWNVEPVAGTRHGLRDESGQIDRVASSYYASVVFDLMEQDVADAIGSDADAGKRVLDAIYDLVYSMLESQYVGH